MCGRCGHLYGRCTLGRCEYLYGRCAGDAVICTGDAGSPQRDASPDRPPARLRGKNSHREPLGDATWADVSISTRDVREMRSSLREMQDLHRETRLPTDPRPESGEKNSHREMLGDAPWGDVTIFRRDLGEMRHL